jgi:TPR repeat protein
MGEWEALALACRLCAWLCGRLCAEFNAAFWGRVRSWERNASNDYELWMEAPAEDRTQAAAAIALSSSDPEAAFRIFLDLAEGGMPWAMETVADRYAGGANLDADFERARDYYCRAIERGSWFATIGYARLLAGHGHFEDCETLLLDGVEQDFIPAFYWLARHRLQQSPGVRTGRAVRPLLERAAEAGHPGAARDLARMKARGQLGLREIPAGYREVRRLARSLTETEEGAPGQVQAAG